VAHEVFISYSFKDKNAANAVCDALESQGIHCWIAPRDIPAGMKWAEAVIKGVENSRLMVIIISHHSNESDQVEREVVWASTKKIDLLPVRIEDIELSDLLKYYLSPVHWLDALMPPLRQHLPRLVETVRKMLGIEAGEPARDEEKEEVKSEPRPAVSSQPVVEKKQAVQKPDKPRTARLPVWAWGAIGVGIALLVFLGLQIGGKLLSPPVMTETLLPTIHPQVPVETFVFEKTEAARATTVAGSETIATVIATWLPKETLTAMPATIQVTATVSENIPTPKAIETSVSTKDGMMQVYVPAGEFFMGSNTGEADEKPLHTVYLDAFWIDQTEVTNGMYGKCEAAGGCTPPLDRSSATRTYYYGNSQYRNYPMINVDWNQAAAYCQWAGRRLPTEAEWEKAARGTDGRSYPWGEGTDCDKANYGGCNGDTRAVGQYPGGASPYTALDMAGNVWEWVNDWYGADYYSQSPDRNPSGPSSGEYRVLRGGSWYDSVNIVRRASRNWYYPVNRFYIIGFRCASSMPEDTRTPESTPIPESTLTTTTAATAIPLAKCSTSGQTQTSPVDGMLLVCVPGGEFQMGSDNGDVDEKPVHAVNVDAFWVDRTEITNGMYKKCEDAGTCTQPQSSSSFLHESYYGNSQYRNHPVIYVDWNQAAAYCQWAGRRLPSEAEWEKAARGADGRTYPWGEGIDCDKANFGGCVNDTVKTGSFASGASPFGARDMAGNVWEWVNDWYDADYYGQSPRNNPQGPVSGQNRVLRGGSWYSDDWEARTTNRNLYDPNKRESITGFRCAASAAP